MLAKVLTGAVVGLDGALTDLAIQNEPGGWMSSVASTGCPRLEHSPLN